MVPNVPVASAPLGALTYVRAHTPRFVAELADFVRFPSVSADPGRRGDVERCARWLAGHLAGIGMERVSLSGAGGPPVVYASHRRAPGRPTVLVYGHYDVQPEDPRDRWISPPFEPEIRDGVLYGRGASDDKGQMFAHVKAMEACLRGEGRLPVNVECLFEGEEETGSTHLAAFLARNRAALAADVAVISDTPMLGPGRPALTYGLRGAVAVEIVMRGARADLHSGLFGGAVPNPLEALARVLSGLHDARGRVAVQGFYDDVAAVGPAERAHLRRVGPTDAELLKRAGAAAIRGEPGYSAHELITIRPSLTINGVTGGYQGAGPKSVIPATASAKLIARLVPNQDPRAIEDLLREHVARLTPPGFRAELRAAIHAAPVLVDRGHPAMRAAARACRGAFGAEPALVRSGGTIPAASMIGEVLGIPPVLMGFALPTDHIHGSNEGFSLRSFRGGITASIRFLREIAQSS